MYLAFLLTGDIFDKLPRQRHSIIRTWDSDTRIGFGIISSATESKRIVCNLPFENQLFGYIHYCTEISLDQFAAKYMQFSP